MIFINSGQLKTQWKTWDTGSGNVKVKIMNNMENGAGWLHFDLGSLMDLFREQKEHKGECYKLLQFDLVGFLYPFTCRVKYLNVAQDTCWHHFTLKTTTSCFDEVLDNGHIRMHYINNAKDMWSHATQATSASCLSDQITEHLGGSLNLYPALSTCVGLPNVWYKLFYPRKKIFLITFIQISLTATKPSFILILAHWTLFPCFLCLHPPAVVSNLQVKWLSVIR